MSRWAISRSRSAAAGEFGSAQLARELVEDAVDHAGFLGINKGRGDVDIFRRHDAGRNVRPAGELISAGAHHRAQDRLDALERPAAIERRVDHRVERPLLAHHAADNIAKVRRLSRHVLRALDLAAEPVAFEFGHDLVQAGTGQIHLIQRLYGGEPGGAALIGLARFFCLGAGGHQRVPRRRLSSMSASAARAASPPLSCSSMRARAKACASFSTVMMPLPIGRPRADKCETISKWMVSPRITQPSATAPSYGRRLRRAASVAIAIAGGISSE